MNKVTTVLLAGGFSALSAVILPSCGATANNTAAVQAPVNGEKVNLALSGLM